MQVRNLICVVNFTADLHRLCAHHGLPPPICPPQHTRSLKRAQTTAAEYLTSEEKVQNQLSDIFCDAQIHLEAIEDINAQYSVLETYQSRLESVKNSFNQNWSWDLELAYQAVRIYVLGIGLLPDISHSDQQAITYRQLILQKCLDAASSYIQIIMNMSYQPASGSRYPSGILTFYPKHYFTTLMAAAAYIFRFLIDSQHINKSQQSLCMTRLTEAHKIFQSFPDHRDAVRGCIQIELLVNCLRSNIRPSSIIVVKHRLGASVVLDASFRAAQQRNTDSVSGATPPVASWNTMNDYYAYRLPVAPEQKVVSPPDQQQQYQQQEQSWQGSDIALGIWDTYANDFGVLNEPWLGTDAEFASVVAMTRSNPNMQGGSTLSDSTHI